MKIKTDKVQTWARVYWRTDPRNNPDELGNRIVNFVGKDEADIRLQLDYYIGHNGIVKCEVVKPEERPNETQSID